MSQNTKLTLAEKHLAVSDPKLALIIKKYQPCKIAPHQDYYAELISSIVSQQLSTKAASTIWKRVLGVFEDKLPTPEQLINADTEKLRACGVSYQKVSYMKDLAQHIIDGRLDMQHITTLPNNELIEQLTAVKGIGQWSAHMFMIFSLGRLDILPIGDLGIKKGIQKIYGLSELPNANQIIKISELNNWSPYESVASWYIWKSLDNK